MYKIAPPDIRRQIEIQMGLKPSEEEPISLDQAKTAKELHTIVKGNKDIQMATEGVVPQNGQPKAR